MEIISALVFVFWSNSDYVASNALQMFLKEAILDINDIELSKNVLKIRVAYSI